MTSAAVTRRGRRSSRRRSRGVLRRPIVVTVSALTTVALFVGYCVGDIADVLPGPLTLAAVSVPVYGDPEQTKAAGNIVGDLDLTKPVDSAAAAKLMNSLLAAEGVGNDTSVIITDAQGNVAAEHEAGTPREPASTMKTLTALAASSTLDMSSTLDTQTFLSQNADGTNVLTIKGNGDMLLSAGDNDPEHTNGRAGLGSLAQSTAAALAQRGITAVQLHYDDTLFGTVRLPDALVDAGYTMYATPVSSMAIDGGRQYTADTPAPADPDASPGYPELSQNTAADAVSTFVRLLAEQSITVEGDPVSGSAPEGLSPIASVSSATLAEIMAYTLRHSDNTLAEEFGRLTALASGQENSPSGATAAVRDALNQLGIDTTGLTMADCSGLSEGSSLTVRTLVAVQQHNLEAGSGAAAAEGLSVSGLTGTASSRYTDDDAAGLLRVKTGSLGTVTSMVGNVSRTNGGALAFAVVVNNPDDMAAARAAIDTFITALVKL